MYTHNTALTRQLHSGSFGHNAKSQPCWDPSHPTLFLQSKTVLHVPMIFCCTNVSGKDKKMTLVENYEAYIKICFTSYAACRGKLEISLQPQCEMLFSHIKATNTHWRERYARRPWQIIVMANHSLLAAFTTKVVPVCSFFFCNKCKRRLTNKTKCSHRLSLIQIWGIAIDRRKHHFRKSDTDIVYRRYFHPLLNTTDSLHNISLNGTRQVSARDSSWCKLMLHTWGYQAWTTLQSRLDGASRRRCTSSSHSPSKPMPG